MSALDLLGLALTTVLAIGFLSALIELLIRIVRGDFLHKEEEDEERGNEEGTSTDR